jgi:hypothetical protein
MDIRIQVLPEAVTVFLRDGGARFDTEAKMAALDTSPSPDHPRSGLALVKATAQAITYSRAIGCNMTTLVIAPDQG